MDAQDHCNLSQRLVNMTLKEAQKTASALGMSIRKTAYGDYRVNVKNAAEKYATYEATIDDAVDTMLAIVKRGIRK